MILIASKSAILHEQDKKCTSVKMDRREPGEPYDSAFEGGR